MRKLSLLALPLVLCCGGPLVGEPGERGPAGEDASAIAAIKANRPHYYRHGPTEIIVPATEERPARVVIRGEVLANTGDVIVNLIGSQDHTLYYLYAINNSPGFALMYSDQAPAYDDTRSYLGAFATGRNEILEFQAEGGKLRLALGDGIVDVFSSDTESAPKVIPVPPSAHFVYGRLSWVIIHAPQEIGYVGGDPLYPLIALRSFSTIAQEHSPQYLEIPLFMPQTIFMEVTHAGDTTSFRTLGWEEDLTIWP